MRVKIERSVRTKTAGFLNKKTADFAAITLVTQLSEEEQAVVKRWDLGDAVVINRACNADEKDISGGDDTWYAIRVRHLQAGQAITTVFALVHQAIAFEEALRAALQSTKSHLDACGSFTSSYDTFEL